MSSEREVTSELVTDIIALSMALKPITEIAKKLLLSENTIEKVLNGYYDHLIKRKTNG